MLQRLQYIKELRSTLIQSIPVWKKGIADYEERGTYDTVDQYGRQILDNTRENIKLLSKGILTIKANKCFLVFRLNRIHSRSLTLAKDRRRLLSLRQVAIAYKQ